MLDFDPKYAYPLIMLLTFLLVVSVPEATLQAFFLPGLSPRVGVAKLFLVDDPFHTLKPIVICL